MEGGASWGQYMGRVADAMGTGWDISLAGRRELQGKKMIYVSVKSECPSLSALLAKGRSESDVFAP